MYCPGEHRTRAICIFVLCLAIIDYRICSACKPDGANKKMNNNRIETPKIISGYWENWRGAINPGGGGNHNPSYYKNDIASTNHVLYSFITLDRRPNPDNPGTKYWDGKALYESMTAANVIDVMTETDPHWENPYEWQRSKIAALIDATRDNNAKFIWAIGGWSDLTKTLHEDQIPLFVDQCIELLKLTGDGIDFDWEHLSQDSEIVDEQRTVLAQTMLALRTGLDKEGMEDKQVGYTTRFNAFWNNDTKPDNYTYFASDGEGLTVEKTLNDLGSSLNAIVNWVHIMAYDVPPTDLNCPDRFTLSTYVGVFDAFAKFVDKDKIIMGFEPGHQAAGGLWEGTEVDKDVINYVQERNYGGVMFWAMNEHASSPETGVTGQNAQDLAKYANGIFNRT